MARDQAGSMQPLCPLYLGVKGVIAKSLARIHMANLVNSGILPLTFANEEDYEGIDQGDELVLEGMPSPRLRQGKGS